MCGVGMRLLLLLQVAHTTSLHPHPRTPTHTHTRTHTQNTITVHAHPTSIYQSIIEKTKSLSFRGSLCAYNVEKREGELSRLQRVPAASAAAAKSAAPQGDAGLVSPA
jgi:hypothetical protein